MLSPRQMQKLEEEHQGDHAAAVVEAFFIYLEFGRRHPPTMQSAVNIAYQRLDPEDYADLMEFLRDTLLSVWHERLKPREVNHGDDSRGDQGTAA